eukprot:scaffold34915_cov180-Amphora_coffeaeformis.AAC.5
MMLMTNYFTKRAGDVDVRRRKINSVALHIFLAFPSRLYALDPFRSVTKKLPKSNMYFLLPSDPVAFRHRANDGGHAIWEMIRSHVRIYHNLVQCVIIYPHRSVDKTGICGETGQAVGYSMAAHGIFADLDEVNHFSWWIQFHGPRRTATKSPLVLDSLESGQLATVFRIGHLIWCVQDFFNAVHIQGGVYRRVDAKIRPTPSADPAYQSVNNFDFGNFYTPNQFQDFVSQDFHRPLR